MSARRSTSGRLGRGAQRLDRPGLGGRDARDGAGRAVVGLARQHVREQDRVAAALGQRRVEVPVEVVEAATALPSASSSQPRTRAAPGGSESSSGASSSSMRCRSPATSRYPASVSSRSARSGDPRGVRRSAWSASAAASWRAPRAQAPRRRCRDRRREPVLGPCVACARCRARRSSSTTTPASFACSASCSARATRGDAAAASSGCAARTRRRRRPGRPPRRAREPGRVADRLQLRDAQVRAQRDGQQQLAHGLGQLLDARAEQVLDRGGHRDAPRRSPGSALGQRAPHLEREERIADVASKSAAGRGAAGSARGAPRGCAAPCRA